MKKLIYLFLFIPLLGFGQTDAQLEKIKPQVVNYFKENLNDFSSYEPMTYYDFKVFKVDSSRYDQIAFIIRHRFRAANQYGGKVIYNYQFNFDYNLKLLKAIDYNAVLEKLDKMRKLNN